MMEMATDRGCKPRHIEAERVPVSATVPREVDLLLGAGEQQVSLHRVFANDSAELHSKNALIVEYRFVRHQSLDSPAIDFVNAVTRAFEKIDGPKNKQPMINILAAMRDTVAAHPGVNPLFAEAVNTVISLP